MIEMKPEKAASGLMIIDWRYITQDKPLALPHVIGTRVAGRTNYLCWHSIL